MENVFSIVFRIVVTILLISYGASEVKAQVYSCETTVKGAVTNPIVIIHVLPEDEITDAEFELVFNSNDSLIYKSIRGIVQNNSGRIQILIPMQSAIAIAPSSLESMIINVTGTFNGKIEKVRRECIVNK